MEQRNYAQMTQEQALQRIVTEYPEFIADAIQIIKDGRNLVDFLSTLDSFY